MNLHTHQLLHHSSNLVSRNPTPKQCVPCQIVIYQEQLPYSPPRRGIRAHMQNHNRNLPKTPTPPNEYRKMIQLHASPSSGRGCGGGVTPPSAWHALEPTHTTAYVNHELTQAAAALVFAPCYNRPPPVYLIHERNAKELTEMNQLKERKEIMELEEREGL